MTECVNMLHHPNSSVGNLKTRRLDKKVQVYSSCVYISVQRRRYLVSKCFSKTLLLGRRCTLVHIFQTISHHLSLFNFHSAIDVAVIPTTISNCCQSIHCWCRIVLNFSTYPQYKIWCGKKYVQFNHLLYDLPILQNLQMRIQKDIKM